MWPGSPELFARDVLRKTNCKVLVSVVDLFEAVIALIITPVDEHGAIRDDRTVFSPTFQSQMSLWQRQRRGTASGKAALRAVCTKMDTGKASAPVVFTRHSLRCIAHVKDTDRA